MEVNVCEDVRTRGNEENSKGGGGFRDKLIELIEAQPLNERRQMGFRVWKKEGSAAVGS